MINTKKCKFDKIELKIGSKIELEHTKSKNRAREIAKQHLCEHAKYYTEGLIPMEKKLSKLNRRVR